MIPGQQLLLDLLVHAEANSPVDASQMTGWVSQELVASLVCKWYLPDGTELPPEGVDWIRYSNVTFRVVKTPGLFAGVICHPSPPTTFAPIDGQN